MTRLHYLLADVFTDTPFGGNPLAVFLEAGDLPATLMQRIAAELNLSETVFVQPPLDPGNDFRLRIFTPAVELPFAGHPTVGTACLLAMTGDGAAAGGELRLEEGVGVVPVEVQPGDARTAKAWLRVETTPEHRTALPAADLAACVSLDSADIDTDGPGLEAVSCGVPFQLIPVRDAKRLARARLDRPAWTRLLSAHWAPHVYLVSAIDAGRRQRFRARMFAPAMGIEEDPATGAAAAAFGAWLQRHRPPASGVSWCDIEQGVEMGRGSRIELGVPAPGSEPPGVRVGGSSVRIGEGYLDLVDG